MIIKTITSFNQFTRTSLLEKVNGYVNKTKNLEAEIMRLKRKYNLPKIYRFDMGENADGFSPKINTYLENLHKNEILFSKLHRYPDITHLNLRERLGAIFGVPRQNIVLSTGSDSLIDLITRVFFEYRDLYLMPVPGFFLFENYSDRMGATPIYLQLDDEDDFAWTDKTSEKLIDIISKFRPKLIWLSNPNNPTGQVIPNDKLLEIIKIADTYNVYVVIDEAYHEFIGDAKDSAIQFTNTYKNLIVLRTFSKAHGLAGLRLGYLISSNPHIIEALLLHRHHFPITQLSLNIAAIATKDLQFIHNTREKTHTRRNNLFKKLDTLETFRYIPSQTSIFMIKNNYLSASELDKKLKSKGIITAYLNITGIDPNNYLRVTILSDNENDYFFQVCKEINHECQILT